MFRAKIMLPVSRRSHWKKTLPSPFLVCFTGRITHPFSYMIDFKLEKTGAYHLISSGLAEREGFEPSRRY